MTQAATIGARARTVVPVVLGLLVALALWVIGGRAGWANGMVVTPRAAIAPIVGDSREVYARAVRSTVWAAFRGLVIGGTLAFVAALVATTIPGLRRSITRLAAIANAAPWVAVAPCLIVILGRDRGPVAVAAIAVFFFIFVSASVGLGAAPRTALDVTTALGASRARRVWSVQLPSMWPSLLDGLKLAAPASLAGAVFGEWYGADRGLGVLLISGMQGARADRLWAASLLCATCGLLAFAALALVRDRAAGRYGATVVQQTTSAEAGFSWKRLLAEVGAIAALVAVLTTAWWAWIEIKDISPLVVPRPRAVWEDLSSNPGDYVSATLATLETAAIALLIGSAVGLVVAFVASQFRFLAGMTVPMVVLLAATPLVALFPLFARIFGYNPNTVRMLAAVMVFYPVFVYTRSGLTAASRATLDVTDAFGASRGRRLQLVVVPEAVPHIVTGFRIAAGSAVIAAVVGETLIGREGLGVEFSYAYTLLDLPRAFGAAIVIVVVSVVVFAIAGWLEHRIHRRWT
jgi:ABC-type nitrate/sulfonate/bicarbonate transport system permease component